MLNILEEIKNYLNTGLLEQISSDLGESRAGVSVALNSLYPTILGGLLQRAEKQEDFSTFYDMIKHNGEAAWLNNLSSLIHHGNLAHNDPKEHAGHMLSSLFGQQVSTILTTVKRVSGLQSESSVSALLGLAGPLVMAYLKKMITTNNLNASALATILIEQKDTLTGAIPYALLNELGFEKPAASTVKSPADNSLVKIFLPLLLLGAAALFFFKYCSPGEVAEDTTSSLENRLIDTSGIPLDTLEQASSDITAVLKEIPSISSAIFKRTIPGGIEIQGSKDGVEARLISFLESGEPIDSTTWFNFDALRFKTASAALDTTYSQTQLNNLVAILEAYPTVYLKLGGYTDSDGPDEVNLKLSQDRADNVRTALLAQGIEPARLRAEGYGEAHPVCPANDTPECKAQNRRTAVRVTGK